MAQGQITVRSEYLFPSAPIAELIASATDHLRVLAVNFSFQGNGVGGGNAMTIGLGVPAATGIPYRPWTPQPTDPSREFSNSAVIATLWTTMPTVPANFLRRVTFSTQSLSGSNGVILERKLVLPRGFMLAASKSLVAWCITAQLQSYIDPEYADVTFEFDA